ncbi:MAG: hypothetical protein KDC71_09050 [Acidobacteria bacterium]|nr:hypothetical protein [Acidobacteriota bacterium]
MKTLYFLLLSATVFAQSNVSGPLPLTLVDGGTDCNGLGRIVLVQADTSGLTGDMGAPVGLNAFRLVLTANRSGVLTSLMPGTQPITWSSVQTEASLVTTQIVITGWNSDINAPNGLYTLASLLLTGDQGPVSISLEATSEVASRLVQPGNGPELLQLQLPGSLQTNIPVTYSLTLQEGFAAWLTVMPTYDLAAPSGKIDILDLSKLVYCTP